MGTDIHAFVEARSSDSGIYASLTQINLNRDYEVFNILGNGRNYSFPKSEWWSEAHIPPRGAPSDISVWTATFFYDLILGSSSPDQGFTPDRWFWKAASCVSKEEAEKRVSAEGSFIGEVQQTFNLKKETKNQHFARWQAVPKVGNHSPSYLSLREIEEAFAVKTLT